VSAADLMAADYPVTIDPEVGSNDFRISNMGPDGSADYDAVTPKVAYNSTDNEYLVVWRADDDTGSLADGENEIYGQRIDAAGAEIGSVFRISNMGTDGDTAYDGYGPTPAYNATDNLYLVVWEGDDVNIAGTLVDGESEIFGQLLTAAGVETGVDDFRISNMGPDANTAYDGYYPDVAWNATDNEFLVVWEGDDDSGSLVDGESEIFGQLIDGATGAEIGSDFRISDMGATDGSIDFKAYRPEVDWNATDNLYLVVWEGDDDTGPLVDGESEIFGQLIDAAGAEIGSDFRISDMGPDGNTGYDAYYPDVAWNSTDNEFLVVWHGDDNTGLFVASEYEIYCQRLLGANGTEIDGDLRLSDMGPDGTPSQFDPFYARVSYNATDNVYLVVWDSDDDTGSLVDGEDEVYFQVVAGETGAEVGPDERISDMGTDGDDASDASEPHAAWNSTDNEFLVVWYGDQDVLPLIDEENEIFGQRLDGAAVPIKVSGYLVD